MVAHPDPVIVRGLLGGEAPSILQRNEQRFLAATLDELSADGGVATVATHLAHMRTPDSTLKLALPSHRAYHLAMIDVVCDTFGLPRLDPRSIDSAGLVLRRVRAEGGMEGWRSAGSTLRGWVPLTPAEIDLDPDPQRRPPLLQSGHPEINRRLAQLQPATQPFSENVAPLHLAPPRVANATARTVLYGLVPVASTEYSEVPDTSGFPPDQLRDHLSSYLKAASGSRAVPSPGSTLTPDDARNLDPASLLATYITDFLQQILYEFDVFGTSQGSQAVFAALQQITLTFADGSTATAGDALKQQVEVLVTQTAGTQVQMPVAWPPISNGVADAIFTAVKAVLDGRWAAVRPREGRFSDPSRQYRLRAFVRVKDADGCPPRIEWSEYSEAFVIAPWYDNAGAAPIQIVLPDISSLSQAVQPNVSFVVPPNLANTLKNSKLKDLLDGNGSSDGSAITWICSFNIPIITICAFLVLNIFLQLFDLVFGWLLWVKICIPVPKKTVSGGP